MPDFLTREQILGANDIAYEVVDVPEWGGKVRLRGMTGSERDEWELLLLQQAAAAGLGVGEGEGAGVKDEKPNVRATLLAFTIVGDDGARVFTAADIAVLGAKSARALQRLYNVARKLARVSEADVKELEKNSNAGHGDASTSTSPGS